MAAAAGDALWPPRAVAHSAIAWSRLFHGRLAPPKVAHPLCAAISACTFQFAAERWTASDPIIAEVEDMDHDSADEDEEDAATKAQINQLVTKLEIENAVAGFVAAAKHKPN